MVWAQSWRRLRSTVTAAVRVPPGRERPEHVREVALDDGELLRSDARSVASTTSFDVPIASASCLGVRRVAIFFTQSSIISSATRPDARSLSKRPGATTGLEVRGPAVIPVRVGMRPKDRVRNPAAFLEDPDLVARAIDREGTQVRLRYVKKRSRGKRDGAGGRYRATQGKPAIRSARSRRSMAEPIAGLLSQFLERPGVLSRLARRVNQLAGQCLDTSSTPRFRERVNAPQAHAVRAPAHNLAEQPHLLIAVRTLPTLAARDRLEQTLRLVPPHPKGRDACARAASPILLGTRLIYRTGVRSDQMSAQLLVLRGRPAADGVARRAPPSRELLFAKGRQARRRQLDGAAGDWSIPYAVGTE